MWAASPMAGRRIALRRFGQNLLCGTSGKLAHDLVAQVVVGQDPEPFGRDHGASRSTVAWISDPLADDVQHLLRVSAAAARPEARTAPSGEDQSVLIGFGHDFQCKRLHQVSRSCYDGEKLANGAIV